MNHAEAVQTQRRLNSECKALTLKALSGSNPQCPQGLRSGLDQVATHGVHEAARCNHASPLGKELPPNAMVALGS